MQNGSDYFEYTYDAVGNITQIKKNGSVYESYTYDSLNQLKTVTRGNDIYTYNYDNGGNIQSVTLNGSIIKNYTYGNSQWKDMLTAYNGQTITYDQIGNPLQYRDGFNFTWSNGRQLTGIKQGTNNISYLYNADGLRASKTVNNITTDYYWLDGVLLGQKTGSNYITYLYDENGTAYGLIYNNSYLYYSFNAQGDVVALVSNSGSVVARYEYDAWGNILSITNNAGVDISQNLNHIANINPIRYRGYYYDYETGFYYLQSRYYDPVTQRFLNADGYVSTGQGMLGYNMFAYCGNNPVIMADPSGQFWGIVLGVTLVVGLVVSLSGCSKPAKETSSTSSVTLPPSPSSSSSNGTSSGAKGNYNDYLSSLRMRESTNNYSAVNQFGYLGAYQMGTGALIDAGFKSDSGNWTSKANEYGVYSSNDFLNSKVAQDSAITAFNKKTVDYIKYFGLDSYIGSSYCGVTITQSGLLASCHLVGVGTMKDALATGAIAWDGNGVPASEYMSLFGGYDISEVW